MATESPPWRQAISIWIACATLGAALGIGWAAEADHAPWTTYYTPDCGAPYDCTRWSEGNRDDVDWKFTEGVPTGAFRDRVKDGAVAWNQVTGSNFKFDWNSGDYADFDPACQENRPYEKNAIHYRDTGVDVIGIVKTCGTPNGGIHDFQLSLDSNLPGSATWYAGTGSTPSSQFDVWAAATHEFGHATGFDLHFYWDSDPSLCGPLVNWPQKQTMCTAGSDIDNLLGRNSFRTLEWHDKSTFKDAYPA